MIELVAHISHVVAQATTRYCPGGGGVCDTGLSRTGATSGNLHSVLQVLFAVAGGIAVVMVVIGGLKFVTAQGESQGVAQARKIIVYALAGLAVSLLAEAIVTFVVNRL